MPVDVKNFHQQEMGLYNKNHGVKEHENIIARNNNLLPNYEDK